MRNSQVSSVEFADPALFPGATPSILHGVKTPETVEDDGVAPSSLDQTKDAPTTETTGYGGGGVY